MVAIGGVALTIAACGSPMPGRCPLENWSGVCQLTSFTKVREVEMPVPHAVYEAIYAPVRNRQSPNYTPPEVRLEVSALSKYEPLLEQHMQVYRQIPCQQTIREGCAYNPVAAQLPEFDPNRYARYAQAQPVGPQGCAKIEEQAGVSVGERGSESLPERFYFARNSANLDANMPPTAQTVARRLFADPGIECVGVVGQSASGESPGLGELRAQAIKRLLVQQGVQPQRMMTISASTPLYGPGSEQEPPKPEDQRVSITVILRGSPPPGGAPSSAPPPAPPASPAPGAPAPVPRQ